MAPEEGHSVDQTLLREDVLFPLLVTQQLSFPIPNFVIASSLFQDGIPPEMVNGIHV